MAVSEDRGVWGSVSKVGVARRLQDFEARFHQLADDNATVEEVFNALRDAMKNAELTVRGADSENAGRWAYKCVPDHPIRVAAARTLAQMLGLIKTSAGVTVNNGPQNTLNVTAGERLSELDAIGVPRAEVEAACLDLLSASKAGQTSGEAPSKAV